MRLLGHGAARSTAHPDLYFQRWIDHDTWPAWSPDTEWVRLDGPARRGTRGVIKPKGAPRAKFVITACEPATSETGAAEYTDTSTLPGATLVFRHIARPSPDGTDLQVDVTMTGPLTFVWARVMGGGFKTSAQADLDRLVTIVEGSQ